MALQTSGPISLNDIKNEFSLTDPVSFSDLYGLAVGIPTSGAISLSDFYGASAFTAPIPPTGIDSSTVDLTISDVNSIPAPSGLWEILVGSPSFGITLGNGDDCAVWFNDTNDAYGDFTDGTPDGMDLDILSFVFYCEDFASNQVDGGLLIGVVEGTEITTADYANGPTDFERIPDQIFADVIDNNGTTSVTLDLYTGFTYNAAINSGGSGLKYMFYKGDATGADTSIGNTQITISNIVYGTTN